MLFQANPIKNEIELINENLNNDLLKLKSFEIDINNSIKKIPYYVKNVKSDCHTETTEVNVWVSNILRRKKSLLKIFNY